MNALDGSDDSRVRESLVFAIASGYVYLSYLPRHKYYDPLATQDVFAAEPDSMFRTVYKTAEMRLEMCGY